MNTISISRFHSAKDNAPKRCDISADDLALELCEPRAIDTDAGVFFGGDDALRKVVKLRLTAWSP